MARAPKRPSTKDHEHAALDALKRQWLDRVDAAKALRAITAGEDSHTMTQEEAAQFQALLEEADSLEAQVHALEASMTEGGTEDDEDQDPGSGGKPTMNKTFDDQVTLLTKRAESAERDADYLTKQLEERDAQIKDLTKRAESAEAQTKQLQEKLDEQDPEAIWKGVNPQLRAMFEKAEKERDEERSARQKQEFIQKVSLFKALPMNPDDDWEVLRDLAMLPAKTHRRVEQLFKAADEGMQQSGIFGEIGRPGTGEILGNAYALLESYAKERVEKGISATFAQALDTVIQQYPHLYKQYKDEQRGGVR